MVLDWSGWKVPVRLVIGRSSVRIRPRAPHNPRSAVLSGPHRVPALAFWSFPLTSHEVVVNLIAGTTTRTGLTVHAELDEGEYPASGSATSRYGHCNSGPSAAATSTASGTTLFTKLTLNGQIIHSRALTSATDILYALILVLLVFGWTGGKALVQISTAGRRIGHAKKHEADEAATADEGSVGGTMSP
jgi:hypothetical protein